MVVARLLLLDVVFEDYDILYTLVLCMTRGATHLTGNSL